MTKSPIVSRTPNAKRAAKRTTQLRKVGKAQVSREANQTQKQSPRQGNEASPNIDDKQSSATSDHIISQKPDSKN